MSMLQLDTSMTDLFFDNPKVLARVTAAERRVMSRQGAFLRRRVRTDILRRTKKHGQRRLTRDASGRFKRGRQVTARPGQPPIVKSRDPNATLKKILFAFQPEQHNVIVGPVFVPSSRLRGSSARTAPQLMEKGGTAEVPQWAPTDANVWQFGTPKKNYDFVKRRTVRGKFSEHPFMGPGLQKELDAGNILGPWGGAVR